LGLRAPDGPLLHLSAFGGLALSQDGSPVTGSAAQRSRLALLAILAVAGDAGISRDKLLLYLWPESDTERGRHALKQAIYSLRRELGEDLIQGTSSICLNRTAITTDVWQLEAAVAALDATGMVSAYRGPFLDGIHLKDSVEFERWSADQRGRYASLWAGAVERLAREAEAQGRWRTAVDHWRSLATVEPLSAKFAEALIRALAESGDVAGALKHYDIHAALLREDLGAEPQPAVAEVANSIRTGAWRATHRGPAISAAHQDTESNSVRVSGPVATEIQAILSSGANAPNTASRAMEQAAPSGRRQRTTALTSLLGIAALVVGVTGAWFGRLDPDSRAALAILVSRDQPNLIPSSIVVAPLENKTNDRALDVFGEQAADWLTRELSENNFKVVDERTTRMNTEVVKHIPRIFRSGDETIALAEETSAAFVVRGNYYKDGDSLEVALSVVDVATHERIKTFGPFKGSPRAPDQLLRRIIPPTLLFLRTFVDPSAGAATTSQATIPSFESFERLSRAWERFFASPGDTAAIFAELDSAHTLDSTYAAPLLMKGYILDVKAQWPPVNRIVQQVRPFAAGLSRFEREALALMEADLRGDALRRLDIAQELRASSPGSAEVPLLVVASALYVGRPRDAVAAVQGTDPDRGINLKSSVYWEWRSTAQHAAGLYSDEEYSARSGLARFRRDASMTFAVARTLAARNDPALADFVARGIPASRGPDAAIRDSTGDRQDMLLFVSQELRAHGFDAEAGAYLQRLNAELAQTAQPLPRATLWRKASALYDAGDYSRARELYARLAQSDSLDVDAEGREAVAAAHLHDFAAAARIDSHLAEMNRPFIHGRHLRWRASIAAARGEADDAIALLEAAVRQGFRLIDTPTQLTIHLDSDFRDLQKTPAFQSMMSRLAAGGTR
jgi:DNA-binding SARP family transcriptional activator/TolB-like protein